MGKKGLKKSNGPELGTRGLHSESGGGRGLTAWDAVCVDLILAISDLLVHKIVCALLRGAPTAHLGVSEIGTEGAQKVKAPSRVARGLHSEGLAVGGDSPPGMLSVLIQYYQFQA